MNRTIYTYKAVNVENGIPNDAITINCSDLQSVFNDFYFNYQSFTKSEKEIDCNGRCVVEGYSTYRAVKLENNHLCFYFDEYGGAEYYIAGEIIKLFKVDIDGCFSEFYIFIDGKLSPIIFVGCRK